MHLRVLFNANYGSVTKTIMVTTCRYHTQYFRKVYLILAFREAENAHVITLVHMNRNEEPRVLKPDKVGNKNNHDQYLFNKKIGYPVPVVLPTVSYYGSVSSVLSGYGFGSFHQLAKN